MRDHPVPCLRLGAVNTIFVADPPASRCAKNHIAKFDPDGGARRRTTRIRLPSAKATTAFVFAFAALKLRRRCFAKRFLAGCAMRSPKGETWGVATVRLRLRLRRDGVRSR